MHYELTALIERDAGWYIGYCPEIQKLTVKVAM